MIKNLKKEDELFYKGYLYVPMFDEDIEVWIEESVDNTYINQCVEHITHLSEDMIDTICDKSIKYYKYMLEE